MRRFIAKSLVAVSVVTVAIATPSVFAAGMLQVAGDNHQAIRIVDHDVNVTINNGFARVEVSQRFANPNNETVEALYSFPLPKSASLAEMSILSGETRLNGEVLPKQQAQSIYDDEKSKGNNTALASQDGYKKLEFRVYPLAAQKEVTVRFVYYEPLTIDSGVGRFVYPLADGGTDEGQNFWGKNEQVDNALSINVDLKSA